MDTKERLCNGLGPGRARFCSPMGSSSRRERKGKSGHKEGEGVEKKTSSHERRENKTERN